MTEFLGDGAFFLTTVIDEMVRKNDDAVRDLGQTFNEMDALAQQFLRRMDANAGALDRVFAMPVQRQLAHASGSVDAYGRSLLALDSGVKRTAGLLTEFAESAAGADGALNTLTETSRQAKDVLVAHQREIRAEIAETRQAMAGLGGGVSLPAGSVTTGGGEQRLLGPAPGAIWGTRGSSAPGSILNPVTVAIEGGQYAGLGSRAAALGYQGTSPGASAGDMGVLTQLLQGINDQLASQAPQQTSPPVIVYVPEAGAGGPGGAGGVPAVPPGGGGGGGSQSQLPPGWWLRQPQLNPPGPYQGGASDYQPDWRIAGVAMGQEIAPILANVLRDTAPGFGHAMGAALVDAMRQGMYATPQPALPAGRTYVLPAGSERRALPPPGGTVGGNLPPGWTTINEPNWVNVSGGEYIGRQEIIEAPWHNIPVSEGGTGIPGGLGGSGGRGGAGGRSGGGGGYYGPPPPPPSDNAGWGAFFGGLFGHGAGSGGGGGFIANLLPGWLGRGLGGFASVGSFGSFAGLGAERLAFTGLSLAGSAAGGAAGAGTLAAGALGTLAVGGGSDLAVMKSTIADTKTIAQQLTAVTSAQQTYNDAVAKYGKNSAQAATALNNLHQQQIAYQQTLQSLGGATAVGVQAEIALAKSATALDTFWDQQTQAARVAAVNILQQVVTLGHDYVPLVANAAQQNLSIINQDIKPLFAWLQGPQGLGIFQNLENNFRNQLPTAIDAFNNGIEAFLRFVSLASNYTGGFVKSIDNLFQKLNGASDATFNNWIQKFVDDFRLWEHFIVLIGQDLYLLFKNDAGLGNNLIASLTTMLQKSKEWLQTTSGSSQASNIFQLHKQEVLDLLSLLHDLANTFGNIYLAIAPSAITIMDDVVLPVLKGVADALTAIAHASPLAADALGVLLIGYKFGGWSTVSRILRTVGLDMGALTTKMGLQAGAADAAAASDARLATSEGALSGANVRLAATMGPLTAEAAGVGGAGSAAAAARAAGVTSAVPAALDEAAPVGLLASLKGGMSAALGPLMAGFGGILAGGFIQQLTGLQQGGGATTGGGIAGGALGAALGTVFGSPVLGTLLGAAVGSTFGPSIGHLLNSIFGNPDYGKTFSTNFASQFKDTVTPAVQASMQHSLDAAYNNVKAAQSSSGLPSSATTKAELARAIAADPNAQAKAIQAAYNHLGTVAAQSFELGYAKVPFPTLSFLVPNLLSNLQSLNPKARLAGAENLIAWAQGMESQGKLPPDAVATIIKAIERQFPGLTQALKTAGDEGGKSFSGLTAGVQKTLATVVAEFAGSNKDILTAGHTLEDQVATAYRLMQQAIAAIMAEIVAEIKKAQSEITAAEKGAQGTQLAQLKKAGELEVAAQHDTGAKRIADLNSANQLLAQAAAKAHGEQLAKIKSAEAANNKAINDANSQQLADLKKYSAQLLGQNSTMLDQLVKQTVAKLNAFTGASGVWVPWSQAAENAMKTLSNAYGDGLIHTTKFMSDMQTIMQAGWSKIQSGVKASYATQTAELQHAFATNQINARQYNAGMNSIRQAENSQEASDLKTFTQNMITSMGSSGKASGQAMEAIVTQMNKLLGPLHATLLPTIAVIPGGGVTVTSHGNPGYARGGLLQVGRPGDAGPDDVEAHFRVGRGEKIAVFTPHQTPYVNEGLRRMGFAGLEGLFSDVRTPNTTRSGWNTGGLPGYSTGGGPGPVASGSPTGTYIYPLPAGASYSRTDEGVDYSMPVGSPIGAIGAGRYINEGPWGGAAGGQPYLVWQLTSGPRAGSYVYVAEQINPLIGPGSSWSSGHTAVATYAPSGTAIEMGWNSGSGVGSTLAAATTGYTEGQVTPAGQDFYAFLQGLAHGIVTGGTNSTLGFVAAKVWNDLKVPPVKGRGAMADLFRAALSKAINAANVYGKKETAKWNASHATSPGTASGQLVPGIMSIEQKAAAAAGLGWDASIVAELLQKESAGGINEPPSGSQSATGPNQVIPSTFARYAYPPPPGMVITNPYDNALASMRYIKATYQTLSSMASQTGLFGSGYKGYAGGGMVDYAGKFGDGGAYTATRPTMAMFGENGPETAVFMPHYSSGGEVVTASTYNDNQAAYPPYTNSGASISRLQSGGSTWWNRLQPGSHWDITYGGRTIDAHVQDWGSGGGPGPSGRPRVVDLWIPGVTGPLGIPNPSGFLNDVTIAPHGSGGGGGSGGIGSTTPGYGGIPGAGQAGSGPPGSYSGGKPTSATGKTSSGYYTRGSGKNYEEYKKNPYTSTWEWLTPSQWNQVFNDFYAHPRKMDPYAPKTSSSGTSAGQGSHKSPPATDPILFGGEHIGSLKMSEAELKKLGLPINDKIQLKSSQIEDFSRKGFKDVLKKLDDFMNQMSPHERYKFFLRTQKELGGANRHIEKKMDHLEAHIDRLHKEAMDATGERRNDLLKKLHDDQKQLHEDNNITQRRDAVLARIQMETLKGLTTRFTQEQAAVQNEQQIFGLLSGLPTTTSLSSLGLGPGKAGHIALHALGLSRKQASALLGQTAASYKAQYDYIERTELPEYTKEQHHLEKLYHDALKDHNKKVADRVLKELDTVTQARLQAETDLQQAQINQIDAIYNNASTRAGNLQNTADLVTAITGLSPGANLRKMGLSPAVLRSLGINPAIAMVGSSVSYFQNLEQQQGGTLTPAQIAEAHKAVNNQNQLLERQQDVDQKALARYEHMLPTLTGAAKTEAQKQMNALANSIVTLESTMQGNTQALKQLTNATNANTTATGQMTGTVAYTYQGQNFLASDTGPNVGVGV